METTTIFTSVENTSNASSYNLTANIIPPWARNVVIVYQALIMVIGVSGNGLLILVQLRNKVRATTDYLVIGMAFFELVCASVQTTVNILRNIPSFWIYMIKSSYYCKLFSFLGFLLPMASNLLLSAIAIDRYLKSCHPLNTFYTERMAKYISIVISISAVVISIPTIPVYTMDPVDHCIVFVHLEQVFVYYQQGLAVITIICFLVIAVSYLKISIKLRKRHQKKIKSKLHFVNRSNIKGNNPESWKSIKHNMKGKEKNLDEQKTDTNFASTCYTNVKSIMSVSIEHTTEETSIRVDNVKTDSESSNQLEGISLDVLTVNEITAKDIGLDKRNPALNDTNMSNIDTGTPDESQAQLTVIQNLNNDEKQVNRMTKIVFTITFLHIFIYLFIWIQVLSGFSMSGLIANYFFYYILNINCILNPIFFFSMSSKCRAGVKMIVCSRR